jgi:hypothetical protein
LQGSDVPHRDLSGSIAQARQSLEGDVWQHLQSAKRFFLQAKDPNNIVLWVFFVADAQTNLAVMPPPSSGSAAEADYNEAVSSACLHRFVFAIWL